MDKELKYKQDDFVIIKNKTEWKKSINDLMPTNRRIKINAINTDGCYIWHANNMESLIFTDNDIESFSNDQGPARHKDGTLVRPPLKISDLPEAKIIPEPDEKPKLRWMTVLIPEFSEMSSDLPESRILLNDLGPNYKYRYFCVRAEDEQDYVNGKRDIRTTSWAECFRPGPNYSERSNTLKDGDYIALARKEEMIITVISGRVYFYGKIVSTLTELDEEQLSLLTWLGRIHYHTRACSIGQIRKEEIQ